MTERRLYLARPIGFCQGVRRALQMFAEQAASHPGIPLYVLHELVHNACVTEQQRRRGAVFVESLAEIPAGSQALLGAHGVPRQVLQQAAERRLDVRDATCPLVVQVQRLAGEESPELPLIFLGDGRHPEVQSILDRAAGREIFLLSGEGDIASLPPMSAALFLCQTTLDSQLVAAVVSELARRIPRLRNCSRLCGSVVSRQEAVRQLSGVCDLMLIVGSPHSSNARSLLQAARGAGMESELVESAEALEALALAERQNIGLASATSAPDEIIAGIIDRLTALGFREEDIAATR